MRRLGMFLQHPYTMIVAVLGVCTMDVLAIRLLNDGLALVERAERFSRHVAKQKATGLTLGNLRLIHDQHLFEFAVADYGRRMEDLNAVYLMLLGMAALCAWRWLLGVHRRAVRATAAQMTYESAAVSGAFFVPIVNLMRPVRVVRGVFRACHPEHKVSPLINVWWMMWVSSILLAVCLFFVEHNTFEARELIELQICVHVLNVVAGLFFIAVIVQLHRLQQRLSPWSTSIGDGVEAVTVEVAEPSDEEV